VSSLWNGQCIIQLYCLPMLSDLTLCKVSLLPEYAFVSICLKAKLSEPPVDGWSVDGRKRSLLLVSCATMAYSITRNGIL
jgi:hypothetical protein